MLVFYVVSLGIGGTLLAASLLLGGDSDHDAMPDADMDVDVDAEIDVGADVDVDAHFDVDADAGEALVAVTDGTMTVNHDAGAIDAVMGWLPFTSMRFWTFFLAFFGLTGTTLILLNLQSSQTIIAVVSALLGYASGMSIVTAVRRLRASQGDSVIGVGDYIGASGTTMLPIARGKTGKVRLQLKGRAIELRAITEEDSSFSIKDEVLVYGITEDGQAIVTRPGNADE